MMMMIFLDIYLLDRLVLYRRPEIFVLGLLSIRVLEKISSFLGMICSAISEN